MPRVPYEPAVWKQTTIRNDYLVSDGQNKYSVPFDLIGELVQIRLTKNTVEVFYLRYNADDFRVWAKNVGNSTETVVDHFLKSGSSPE